MTILSQAEIEKLEAFNEDEVMVNAVKKVLLIGKNVNGVAKAGEPMNDLMTNPAFHPYVAQRNSGNIDFEAVGKEVGLMVEAYNIIEDGFDTISTYRKPTKGSNKPKNTAV